MVNFSMKKPKCSYLFFKITMRIHITVDKLKERHIKQKLKKLKISGPRMISMKYE